MTQTVGMLALEEAKGKGKIRERKQLKSQGNAGVQRRWTKLGKKR